MSTDQLRRAAEAMRKEGGPFLEATANLLDHLRLTHKADRYAEVVAESFLTDPGDVPEAVL